MPGRPFPAENYGRSGSHGQQGEKRMDKPQLAVNEVVFFE